jgi:hypothetical protein
LFRNVAALFGIRWGLGRVRTQSSLVSVGVRFIVAVLHTVAQVTFCETLGIWLWSAGKFVCSTLLARLRTTTIGLGPIRRGLGFIRWGLGRVRTQSSLVSVGVRFIVAVLHFVAQVIFGETLGIWLWSAGKFVCSTLRTNLRTARYFCFVLTTTAILATVTSFVKLDA